MDEGFRTPWSEHTIINENELKNHLCEGEELEEKKIKVSSYTVSPNYGTIDYDSFIEFLGEKYMYFAFPEEKVEEFDRPMHRAQKLSDYKEDARYDGKWGELILFTLVDGILDIPMVSHKLGWKQNPVDQIKGSDGLFFGKYEGSPSLGLGEAKMYSDLADGIEEALDSTDRFHEDGSQVRNQHELAVAAGNLSENLSSEKIEELASLFTTKQRDYQIMHPIFIGYDEPELAELQEEPAENDGELLDRIQKHLSETNLLSKVKEEVEDEYDHLKKHWLVFFFLPLEDKDRFSEKMKGEIYPYSTGD
ncbi:DUF1837 domain-containing protein [Halarchaeum sp. CBA1220]|uniref:HamA C-terminal domain-containing protein n=1 Tax=Halarchaeum sp. CBA1220 TaxID=1853682 RepID=UPI000F3A7F48|nr:DUF1837 domain-containing protein [Halarchaeum sp. CBA1220]QLC34350.1 DUF1837 domain-containing protein [Halarchaeum sp. CBA1220]